jgi:hypothetical protein
VSFVVIGLNFVEFRRGGQYEKHIVAAWSMKTISAFIPRHK